MRQIDPWKTAMHRKGPSQPLKLALKQGLIVGKEVLDYGSGRGADVLHLRSLGYKAEGYDPGAHGKVLRYNVLSWSGVLDHDTVMLTYVLNVIPDTKERDLTLCKAYMAARRRIIVTVRPHMDGAAQGWEKHGDGFITSKGTFQRFWPSSKAFARWVKARLDAFGFVAEVRLVAPYMVVIDPPSLPVE